MPFLVLQSGVEMRVNFERNNLLGFTLHTQLLDNKLMKERTSLSYFIHILLNFVFLSHCFWSWNIQFFDICCWTSWAAVYGFVSRVGMHGAGYVTVLTCMNTSKKILNIYRRTWHAYVRQAYSFFRSSFLLR